MAPPGLLSVAIAVTKREHHPAKPMHPLIGPLDFLIASAGGGRE